MSERALMLGLLSEPQVFESKFSWIVSLR